jgi:hypothetical protein
VNGTAAILRLSASRAPSSEAEVQLLASSVWTVRAGEVARVEFYGNRKDPIEASSLSSTA